MTILALALSLLLLGSAAALRFGGASLVRTPRAEALHDAAEGDERAAVVADLLEDRASLQPSLGVVHAAVLVAAAIPATWAIAALVSGWLLAVALVGLGILLVLVGDSLPRSWGRARPRGPAYRLAPLLRVAVSLGEAATDLLQEDEHGEDRDEGGDEQDREELQLITSVLEFTDAIVREVMVPRTDMVVVPADADSDAALDVVIAEGRSRIPVTGESLDDIVGVLYARELLSLFDEGSGSRPVAELMRPAHFVPETKRVSELLRELQENKVHMVVVVDEFGGTAGLVTIEDLIEELVGEIVDEYDVEEPMVTPLPGGGYLVDARLAIDELVRLVGAELPTAEWDTVGGLVLGLAGRVPREGESFEYRGVELTTERVQGRRVSRVRVRRA